MQCETILFTFSVIIFSVNCLRIIYNNEWQKYSNNMQNLRYEPPLFVILCQTGGLSCDDMESCVTRVQSIQDSHLKEWNQMIYNYLIGGDGTIYEGSGFYGRANFLGPLKRKCILITFIGDFKDTNPSDNAWNSLNDLLNFAKRLRYLNNDYVLLSSNQVKFNNRFKDHGNVSEDSIYQTIKTYPNWKNITIIIGTRLF